MASRDRFATPGYLGRFAPSPTGDLHFGSLVAAVGSFLQVRSKGGRWLVRVEDIDPPREVAGSAERILAALAQLGMEPDGEVLYQGTRGKAYREAWQKLLDSGSAFWCGCSRSDLPTGGVYPGTCRQGLPRGREPRSIRLRAGNDSVVFTDRVFGVIRQDLARHAGDFVVRRADGQAAYHLAVVVDDAWQGVTEVVRGADLLESTPRQVFLQRQLGLPTPRYLHLPLAVAAHGLKLSKRLGADPLNADDPAECIGQALQFLGHPPPPGLSLAGLWDWSMENWDPDSIPRARHIVWPEISGQAG